MKIRLDARVLMDKNYSGISEYTANLLSALLKIDKQNHSIGLLNNQLKKTEVEIISYVTSKSRRFTRPFRIISRKIFGGKHEN